MSGGHTRGTMKAITQHRYGGVDMLRYADVPVPAVGDDEVLIRVRAASVNAADWLLMRGEPLVVRLAFGLRGPKIPTRGRDAAGVVEATGRNAHRFAVGDEVYAEVDAGSFAEYTVAAEKRIAKKPANLTFEQAAAVPIAATTALQGLRDVAKVRPGDKVLITGASGGVGSFAVQIASAFGAEVTGVCSTRNLELVRSLGADRVIDYSTDDFTAVGEHYDVMFDLVGNRSLAQCRHALTRRGTLVLSSGGGGRLLGPIGRIAAAAAVGILTTQRLRPLVSSGNADDLSALRDLIESGQLTPSVARTYPLAETAEALRLFGGAHAGGKIVISVSPA